MIKLNTIKENLIKVEEVAQIIGRYKSTVDKYVASGLLPKHYKRDDKLRKTRYWKKQDVINALPKLREYQDLTTGQRPQKPRKSRKAIDRSYRPPLTAAQAAANTAFNLTIGKD